MIHREKGFTLLELMVTTAIIGILIATAVPIYHLYQQRAYGSEAAIMLKQLAEAEIYYYQENDSYYPEGAPITILNEGGMTPENAIEDVKNNLNIEIPQGHFMDYQITAGEDFVYIQINSAGNFNLFKDAPFVFVTVDKNGKTEYSFAGAY